MFRDGDFRPLVHNTEIIQSNAKTAWIGRDIALSQGVLIPAGETEKITFNTKTLLDSLAGKINGGIPDLGIYLRSGIAQADFNIPDSVGSRITNALRFAQITGEHTDVSIPLQNLSSDYARHIPENTGIIQLYHWPEKVTLRGKLLQKAVEEGKIQFGNNNVWEYLYGEDTEETDENIIGIRVKLQGNKQRLGKLQPANTYDNLEVPEGGIHEFRKYIARYRESVSHTLGEPFSWVDSTATAISLKDVHALIINPNHSSSRFMKGQLDSKNRPQTNWPLVGEFFSHGEETHMDFLFANAA